MIDGLKSGRVGSLALDVYEEEAELFFGILPLHASSPAALDSATGPTSDAPALPVAA